MTVKQEFDAMMAQQVEQRFKGISIMLGSELNEYDDKYVDDLYYIATDDGIVIEYGFDSIYDIYCWLKQCE